MAQDPKPKTDKIRQPEAHYRTPDDLVQDRHLSEQDKKHALNTWEQDARQLMTASNEGMTGSEEGLKPDDHHRMGEVVRAKEKIGEKPKHKPSH
jgi:hypothetical protein